MSSRDLSQKIALAIAEWLACRSAGSPALGPRPLVPETGIARPAMTAN
jgi:hypothetical protein